MMTWNPSGTPTPDFAAPGKALILDATLCHTNTEFMRSGIVSTAPPGSGQVNRRSFLKSGLAVASGLAMFVPGRALGADGATAPSNRVTVGLIGRGAMGRGHLERLAHDQGFQLIALCEVDKERREQGLATTEAIYAQAKTAGTYKGCTAYVDYRDMLARSDLDAVLIASPDHWHTMQSIDAVRAGKDVYCEKPVSLTMEEGRRLVEEVRAHKRVFQTGTQYRSATPLRTVCQFIREGRLGKVKSVFTLLQPINNFMAWRFKGKDAALWRSCGESFLPLDFALPKEPVPEGLDWNLWVGPAPSTVSCRGLLTRRSARFLRPGSCRTART